MKVVYMGSPEFALFGLQALHESKHEIVAVVTREDKVKGRKKQLCPTMVKTAAEELGYTVYTPKNPNDGDFLDILKSLDADIIVVSAYGKILKWDILSLYKYGAINIHGSLLPLYRGASPINSVIINGEKETGVTIMFMDEGMDEGDICIKKPLSIGENENFAELRDRMGILGGKGLIEALTLIEKGVAPRTRQSKCHATYCAPLTREDEKISWHQDGRLIHNRIRGLAPEPGAYTYLGKDIVKILETRFEEDCEKGENREIYGTILGMDKKKGVSVSVNGGVLWLLTVKPAGKKGMSSQDWFRGLRKSEELRFTELPINE